jgi:hypothetical protein
MTHNITKEVARWLSWLYLLSLAACGGLPESFATLSLEEQVAAYESNFQKYGGPLVEARAQISAHGLAAADLMAEYVQGKRKGLPKEEAISIIHEVQRRGFSLQGTKAENALQEFLRAEPAGSIDA